MPRRLLARCREDSIREFRAAAQQRYDDAIALAAVHRRTAAIYLWGYTAEMTLKAAYFSLIGHAETDILTWKGNILPAIDRGRTALQIPWPHSGQGHNVRAWAELVVLERATNTAWNYALAGFGLQVQNIGQRFEPLWRETLRYRKNVAYRYEVGQMREAAEWLLINSHVL
ncbi:MAG: hypothetical protein K8T91_16565 [Planctomycetes bacterium]|nr:hypothetical protein [Planctomycetota bacterium]